MRLKANKTSIAKPNPSSEMLRGYDPHEFRSVSVARRLEVMGTQIPSNTHQFLAEFKVCHLNVHSLQCLFIPAFELGIKGKSGEGDRCSRRPEHL